MVAVDGSPPSRAAWIETLMLPVDIVHLEVAALAGGVD